MISILRGINISNVTKLKTKDIHQASTVAILRLLLSLPIFSNFSFQKNKRKKRRLYSSSLRLLLSLPIFSNFSFQKNKRKKPKVALFLTPPSQTSPYPECQTINLYCGFFAGQSWEIGNCFASAAWKMKEILGSVE